MTMGAPELRINLGSLKRQDPYIDSIIDSSTHVAVYTFSPQQNQWEKTEVEGALFVYKRVAPPYWGFTIMNRLSMENLTEPLASELEFQFQNPFLLYRNAKLLIYGIWFYDQDDCKRIGELLKRLCIESDKPPPEVKNLPPTKLFAGGDADYFMKGPVIKSSSPASNSANSISPGSSVGAPPQQTSNGEPDSECEEKELVKSSKNSRSVDILDLLSKAQDKFEKEKRNTPDPVTGELKSSSIAIPGVSENHIVKPVPLKPVNQQKLDIAALFKQHPPGGAISFSLNPNRSNIGTSNFQVTGMNDPIHGGTNVMAAIPPGMPMAISPHPVVRKLGRSHSMTEVPIGKHIDLRMGGPVLSVEEVEKGLSRNVPMATADERQQQLNSTLDKMIDRINSGQALSTTEHIPRVSTLPVLSEVAAPVANINSVPGLASNVGNQARYQENNVFAGTNTQTTGGFTNRSLQHLLPKTRSGVQRSMSSSALSSGDVFPKSTSVSAGLQFKTNFPIPQMPNTATVQARKDGQDFILASSSSSLHASGMSSNDIELPADHAKSVPTAVTVANIGKVLKPNVSQVPVISKVSNGSTPNTLISPEDFERSATTPQKTLELKQRLLDAPKTGIIGSSPIPDPLTKNQLRNALISLLQKDDTFLSAIHDVYLTNFEHLSS